MEKVRSKTMAKVTEEGNASRSTPTPESRRQSLLCPEVQAPGGAVEGTWPCLRFPFGGQVPH